MDVFLVKRAVHSGILCVIFQSVLAAYCPPPLDPDLFITPLNLEGLSGSCLLIPCNFRVKEGKQFPGHKNAAAVWIRTKSQFEKPNSKYVVFNSSRTSMNYPMKITGNISQKDCTTEFNDLKSEYTESYFFRVEDGSFKSTASCSAVNITVRDSPWIPSIEVSGNQTETEEVTITCSAFTPCPRDPPELTWDLHQGTTNNNLQPNGTFTTKITQTITLTSSHDGRNITCSAAYPVSGGKHKKAQTTFTLNVTRTDSDKAGDVAKWLPAVVVLIALIVVLVLIWHFKFRRVHLQSPQVQTLDEVIEQEPAHTEDSLHYEDVSFSRKNPAPVISCSQEETVYSQVKLSNCNVTENTEMADIYAQVKKT